MQIFNTMTRQKEEFVPQKEGEYRIYVCGPTVYNYIHIGNARPMIVFDTLRRYLEYCGNKVYYVSNITDIDDKLIKKGQEEGTSMQEVARKFEAEYIRDSDGLNVKAPTVRPRATEHIRRDHPHRQGPRGLRPRLCGPQRGCLLPRQVRPRLRQAEPPESGRPRERQP